MTPPASLPADNPDRVPARSPDAPRYTVDHAAQETVILKWLQSIDGKLDAFQESIRAAVEGKASVNDLRDLANREARDVEALDKRVDAIEDWRASEIQRQGDAEERRNEAIRLSDRRWAIVRWALGIFAALLTAAITAHIVF